MDSEPSKTTVYFDGSCQLCQAEIRYYRRKDKAADLDFVDVSKSGALTPEGITQQQATQRFHVRTSDGRVLSGAAAFVEVWRLVYLIGTGRHGPRRCLECWPPWSTATKLFSRSGRWSPAFSQASCNFIR